MLDKSVSFYLSKTRFNLFIVVQDGNRSPPSYSSNREIIKSNFVLVGWREQQQTMLKEGSRFRLLFNSILPRCLPRERKRTGPVPLARDLLKRSRIEGNTNKRKVKLRRSSKRTNMNSTRCTNDFPRWKMEALLPCRLVPILIYLAQHLIFFLKHFTSLASPRPYCPSPSLPSSPSTRVISRVSRLCKDLPAPETRIPSDTPFSK